MPDTKWRSIEGDQEVFEYRQKKATPLLDSANDVLRRILLNDVSSPKKRRSSKTKIHEDRLVGQIPPSLLSADRYTHEHCGNNYSRKLGHVAPRSMAFGALQSHSADQPLNALPILHSISSRILRLRFISLSFGAIGCRRPRSLGMA